MVRDLHVGRCGGDGVTAVLQPRTTDVRIERSGVYDLSEDVYFGDPIEGGSLSASGAKLLLPPSCPALFRYAADNPPKTKRVFDLGHAAHKLVLGAGTPLVEIKAKDYKTKAAQQDAIQVRAEGKVPLLTHEMNQVTAMVAALRRNPLALALLNPERGKPEQSIFWTDERTGVNRRARLDWLPDAARERFIIPDYKTAPSANPADFAKAVHNYRYHIQDVWYRDAVKGAGLAEDPLFVFIVQAKEAPYLVTPIQLDDDTKRVGRNLTDQAIDMFQRCTETNHWPDFADGDIPEVGLPSWVVRDHDNS